MDQSGTDGESRARIAYMPNQVTCSGPSRVCCAIRAVGNLFVVARAAHSHSSQMATSAEAECHPNPLSIAAYSTCPSGLWHEAIAPLLTAPEMVMLNIGANKGYNLVEFVQRYSAAPANLTHANWYSLLGSTAARRSAAASVACAGRSASSSRRRRACTCTRSSCSRPTRRCCRSSSGSPACR